VPGIDNFTGAGVYYGAASVEASACKNETIYIVGGANSACQAALHMSKFAKEVNILIRRDALKLVAANYLVENISKTHNIKVLPHTEVAYVTGEKVLEKSHLKIHKRVKNVQFLQKHYLFILVQDPALPGSTI
jgi:thioredoxin reductase (NADPH)